MNLKEYIRDVPDFPRKGILFRDITSLLEQPEAFREVIREMSTKWRDKIDVITALDARGFIFGGALSVELGVPLVLARKKGKLPGKTVSVSYGLEYGTDTLEMHADSLTSGMRVLVVDDLLATGGTASAACSLIEKLGAEVAGCAFVIELEGLGGRENLSKYQIQSLVRYTEETNE
ncbi:MAG: adenine phosphoribosyltransferase [Candidatus Harrisonbacteria bacterium]|nr:adenine phosphoribosyltransferase [Candidatus Harrisonbacteria bacterium]